MHFALISKILGLLLVVFSFTMMPPVAVSYWYPVSYTHLTLPTSDLV